MDIKEDEGKIKLSWDRVVSQFTNLIKFAAKQEAQKNRGDIMISAEDLYQEGMIKLYDCWMKWCVNPENNKDMDEFGPIFRKSLFRAVKKGSKKRGSVDEDNNPKIQFIDLEDAVMENMASDMNAEDIVENMYREHGLQCLSEMLSSAIAKDLLQELIEPSPRTLYEVWADLKRKEMLKAQGKRVNIPKDNTVRMKHIVRALGITGKQYDIAIAEIKEKAPIALAF